MEEVALGNVFVSELLGTAALLLLGAGVVANVLLARSKGFAGGWLLISFGWGLAVFIGVYIAWQSGGHINPAVTIALLAAGKEEYAPGVEVTATSTIVYLGAQMLGAFVGAVLAWLAYKKHFDEHTVAAEKLAIFSTGPAIRSYSWNFVTEVIGTFVLIFWILVSGETPTQIGPLAVALVIVGIGASLGGPTGYAINPARDLGPRIAHAVLPIPGKGSSDWSYSWVPVAGPIVGAVLAALVWRLAF